MPAFLHTCYRIGDIDRSVAFYEKLGLEEIRRMPIGDGEATNCFTPKHICLAIAKWHGFSPKTERITINPAKAGLAGWSTMGNATGKKGDSWFTEKKGETLSQEVTATAPSTIYFICAVHPWMHGQVKVLPPPTS